MSTSKYCESEPRLSRVSTADVASGTGGAPVSGYRPFPAIACRMFMSPISNQTPLWTMQPMIASVLAHAEPRVSVLLSELRAQDVRCPPVAQLEKLQQHPPEQSSGLSSSRSSITSSPNAPVPGARPSCLNCSIFRAHGAHFQVITRTTS